MKGEVHDENCFALGGEAGHAGLFGTIDGVLGFARSLLDGTGASETMLAAMREPVERHRTCGWEHKFDGWSGGDGCSYDTIGHTGFTGTGLWIDFKRGVAWALLTNRVHPARSAGKEIVRLRRETGEAVIAAWDQSEQGLGQ